MANPVRNGLPPSTLFRSDDEQKHLFPKNFVSVRVSKYITDNFESVMSPT